MNVSESEQLVRIFLSNKIKIDYCPDPPDGLYGIDPNEEYLFTFRLFGHTGVGGSEFVTISRTTGDVKYLGHIGE